MAKSRRNASSDVSINILGLDPSTLLTVEEVAAKLKASERSVRRYIANGDLPAYRWGARAIRIRVADLETLMLRQIPTWGSS
jgi:excisionase family DNA binding protein